MPMQSDAAVLARAISVLILDVDGVLTDGGLYYDSQGAVMKRFNVQDGLGIKLAQASGVRVAVITGLDSTAVATRVRELGITKYYPGFVDKVDSMEEIRHDWGVDYENVAFLGDDWVDGKVMRKVGLPMAVSNARPEIRRLARWISTLSGGQGAVREAIDFLLQAQGKLDDMWQRWTT